MWWDIVLRKTSTGETRTIKWDEPESEKLMRFIWEEGNYACDCNRHLFFERSKGNEPEWDSYDCGETEYELLCFTPATDNNPATKP